MILNLKEKKKDSISYRMRLMPTIPFFIWEDAPHTFLPKGKSYKS